MFSDVIKKFLIVVSGILVISFVVYKIEEDKRYRQSKIKEKEYVHNKFINTYAKNNPEKKELEIYFDGDKVKSFPNPKNNLFVDRYRNYYGDTKTIYIDVYTFEAYRVVAKGYCSDGIGCNIDILENNRKAKDSIRDSEIMQNRHTEGKNYEIENNGVQIDDDVDYIDQDDKGRVRLYFNGEFIKRFKNAMENTRLIPLEVEDGVFFELRQYLGYRKIGNLECLKTCIVETYY